MIKLILGDCLEKMKDIPDGSIDLVLVDLPYGTTRNTWDSVIPLEHMWREVLRVTKNNGAMVFTTQAPFSAVLMTSNIALFKYEWIWQKDAGTGHLNAKCAPMKDHENVLVFSRGASSFTKDPSRSMTYNPQMVAGTPYEQKQGSKSANYDPNWQKQVTTTNKGERYPKTVQKFNRDKEKLHPTQKPVALMEYLIKTYTNENETVLDFTMGSGTTMVACQNLNRNGIGIELDITYYDIACKRIGIDTPTHSVS
jgi:DNA modification methylase